MQLVTCCLHHKWVTGVDISRVSMCKHKVCVCVCVLVQDLFATVAVVSLRSSFVLSSKQRNKGENQDTGQ